MRRERHIPTDPRGSAPNLEAEQDAPEALRSIKVLRAALNECRRCELWRQATQGVPGEGMRHAPLMLVGEAPGDAEDREGHPFVGPAGALLNRALAQAGIDREQAYVTNAVKHFKFEPRGKRRLHSKPNAGEIKACRWWLSQEIELVAPRLIVALGATAAQSLLGKAVTIAGTRGRPLPLGERASLIVTVHPSYLLRIPEEVRKRAEYERFVKDLTLARNALH